MQWEIVMKTKFLNNWRYITSLGFRWSNFLLFIFKLYISLTAQWVNENFDCKYQDWPWRVRILAKTFVITLRMCLVIRKLPWIMVTFFCETMQETLKSTNKTRSLASCSRCGYKVKLNIFYAKETKKAKMRCPVLCR